MLYNLQSYLSFFFFLRQGPPLDKFLPDIVRDLHQGARKGVHCPADLHQGVVRRQSLELIRRRDERQTCT